MFWQLTNFWWQFCLLALSCYLFGSINYSVIFSKHLKKDDIRKHGSGNAGTTNMFRVFGLKMSLLTFCCDCLKGVVACLVARAIFCGIGCYDGSAFTVYFTGFFTVLGHVLPVWYKMKGGKGFATSIGIGFVAQPILTLCLIALLVVIVLLFDRMSIAALSFVFLYTLYNWIFLFAVVGIEACIFSTMITLVVFVSHRHNILRLFCGTELPTGIKKLLQKKQETSTDDVEKPL